MNDVRRAAEFVALYGMVLIMTAVALVLILEVAGVFAA
jgi:hypothetical protein